ncbi:MAG: dienelactone hydrolase family protein [Phycisphaerales bacterium]
MRRFALAFASIALASGADAQPADPARERLEHSPRHHEWVEVAAGDRTVRTFVVYPEVSEPRAAVVIIHENRGLNDWARSVADRVAELGYVALAPDLLSGTGPGGGGTEAFESSDAARNGIYELPAEQVTSDLHAVVEHARAMAATTETVMVGGFCWGGSQTFRLATNNDTIAAAFVFYGSAPDGGYDRIVCPVYGFYGGDDFRITGAVPEVTDRMDGAGKRYDATVYEGAGHAFMRSGEMPGASDANREAMESAWTRWAGLLAQHAGRT